MSIPADSILVRIDKVDGKSRRVECNEELVTGLQSQQAKDIVTMEGLGEEISNVLYAKSFVVRGEGLAVVCAVGSRTQAGMPAMIPHDSELNNETSHLRRMFARYSLKLGSYSNYIVILIILIVPFRRLLEFFNLIPCPLGDELDENGLNPC